jgi:hypothetical protein
MKKKGKKKEHVADNYLSLNDHCDLATLEKRGNNVVW